MHLNAQFMWSYFEEKPKPYNLKGGSKLILPKTKSSRFGINSLRFIYLHPLETRIQESGKYSLYLLIVLLKHIFYDCFPILLIQEY